MWLARARKFASVSLAVAPLATPSTFVLSAALIKPAALVVAFECEWLVADLASSAVCRPVTVEIACSPVWLARARKFASVSLAVAPVAIPFNFVLSAADIEPGAEVEAASSDTSSPVFRSGSE